MREVTIRRDDAGQRLDRFLRKLLPASALGNLFKILRKGLVRVNGRRADGELRLAEGDKVEIRIADDALRGLREGGALGEFGQKVTERREPSAFPPNTPKLKVLFRDEHVLAVDKPPFVLVQPGEGGDDATLDQQVLAFIGPGESLTFHPGLAHRLDRGTSGIVLFGLSAEGLRGLTEAFRHRKVEKRYVALVWGNPEKDEFTVDLPLARDPSDESRGKRVKVSRGADAQEAETHFTVLGRNTDWGLALIEARPKTGRTHQIRAHLRAVGLPIVGDPTYGDPRKEREKTGSGRLRRQFLHAWSIRLAHPAGLDAEIRVRSPAPEDLRRTLAWAGLSGAWPKD
ncbi:MAG: RluA family pseudouridine synthase [Planctomycetes bacterium]|nr:RluA family pseudouridine synthase [Planctomycetota bacterium]